MNKYHNQIWEIDGIKFHSKKEAGHYVELKYAKRAGDLSFFLRQVPFDLPGGTKYVLDFLEFWANGDIVYTDVKGFKTPIYLMKKKQVEALYPIKITEQ